MSLHALRLPYNTRIPTMDFELNWNGLLLGWRRSSANQSYKNTWQILLYEADDTSGGNNEGREIPGKLGLINSSAMCFISEI
jgi:hypothetical protein